MHKLIVSL